jgi:hypothetical protein
VLAPSDGQDRRENTEAGREMQTGEEQVEKELIKTSRIKEREQEEGGGTDVERR